MKDKKLHLSNLSISSFTTSEGKAIKGGAGSFWYSDCCSGEYTCDGWCDEEDPTFP
ncbi:hypothetical protein AB9P05_14100 [Roseivirga sp. BDSF3-8]|uniref:hypothetical protein n=1 Tax=Roseivirga sp. BDSF3-8 TaxID=3241598 RepID=UPI003531A656